jgi:hypothetical protein
VTVNAIWDATPCSLTENYQRFRGICCLELQGNLYLQDRCRPALKIQAAEDCYIRYHGMASRLWKYYVLLPRDTKEQNITTSEAVKADSIRMTVRYRKSNIWTNAIAVLSNYVPYSSHKHGASGSASFSHLSNTRINKQDGIFLRTPNSLPPANIHYSEAV